MTSVQKWKPGDIGVNVRHGYRGIFVKDCPTHDRDCWHNESGYSDAAWDERRPLAVIDPENREEVERLDRLQDEEYRALGHEVVQKDCDVEVLQAALREFAAPTPQIEEPTGLGAVVEDESGTKWVAGPGCPGGRRWESEYGGNEPAYFRDLHVALLLSEGVQP